MELQPIQSKIYEIRGQRVMLDRDLAELYQVTTSALNQAVKRNIERFPPDFMFQLTDAETENWKSQIVITNSCLFYAATPMRLPSKAFLCYRLF